MKDTRLLMGMPITIEIIDIKATVDHLNLIYDYFNYIDHKFSPYKDTSEITHINRGLVKAADYSPDMKTVIDLSEKTKNETNGYFDIHHLGKIDPSGLVKGWAIFNAALILKNHGFKNFYIEAGGDIQAYGHNCQNHPWVVGIRNPFNINQIIKKVSLNDCAMATSGTYFRGLHIYNPKKPTHPITKVVSISVIGPDIYDADRFATAAFAMGIDGVSFIEKLPRHEAYQIDNNGLATFTSNFNKFVINS